MDVQRLFEAVKSEPDHHTLLVVANELQRQGYAVTVEGKLQGLKDLEEAEAKGELDQLPVGIGVALEIRKGNEKQAFRLHFLDNDAVCITDLKSPPVTYDPGFTINDFRLG